MSAPKIQEFSGKRVLVVGLGLHGGAVSAVRWLVKHGARVRVTDLKSTAALRKSQRALRGLRTVTYSLGGHRPADFAWAEVIYQNQSVPPNLPELRTARRQGKPIVNETTIFFERCPARIVGVTGTRGKSTTTALLGAMLRQVDAHTIVSGNIRQRPMLDVLDRLSKTDTVVLELSSFQLEFLPSIRRSPALAVFTNLKVDHLNRYGSMSAYAKAKYEIVRWQKHQDTAVLNYDSAFARRAKTFTKANVIWFSRDHKPPGRSVRRQGSWVVESAGRTVRRLFPLNIWPLAGDHQQENLLAATAAALAWGVPAPAIKRAVRAFRHLPHRQELVRIWRGHPFINDTTATTPDGTLAALNVFPNAVFILGGTDKQLNFRLLVDRLAGRRLPIVWLPGTATEKLWSALRRRGWRGRHAFAETMAEAVHHAAEFVKPKQAVVLSPGAASFGLFHHEFDRGEQFIRAVKRL